MPSFTQLLAGGFRGLSRAALRAGAAGRRAGRRDPGGERCPALDRAADDRAPLSTRSRRSQPQFDPEHGGFGRAPKFPPARTSSSCSGPGARTRSSWCGRRSTGWPPAACTTSSAEASTATPWTTAGSSPTSRRCSTTTRCSPASYLHAWVVTGEERYRRIAEETLDYMVRELRLPEGGFASAQDADTAGVEGLTYTWTAGTRVRRSPRGSSRSRGPRSSSEASCPPTPSSSCSRSASAEQQPLRDDKVDHRLERPRARRIRRGRVAARPSRLPRGGARPGALPGGGDDGRATAVLFRTYRDGVAKIDGLPRGLCRRRQRVHRAPLGDRRPALARGGRPVADRAERFWDEERGGYFVDDHGLDRAAKGVRRPPHSLGKLDDGLRRSFGWRRIYGDDEIEKRAVGVFRLARPLLERAPTAFGHLLCALDLHFSPPREVAVVGAPRRFAVQPSKASSRTRSSPSRRSRPTRSRSLPARASWTAIRPPMSASASPARRRSRTPQSSQPRLPRPVAAPRPPRSRASRARA